MHQDDIKGTEVGPFNVIVGPNPLSSSSLHNLDAGKPCMLTEGHEGMTSPTQRSVPVVWTPSKQLERLTVWNLQATLLTKAVEGWLYSVYPTRPVPTAALFTRWLGKHGGNEYVQAISWWESAFQLRHPLSNNWEQPAASTSAPE